MKAVILAAGEGKRMRPLTLKTPKPLLRLGAETLLDRTFSALPEEIDEAILVVNYLGEQIKNYCGKEFHGRKITYVQGKTKGTGFDLMASRGYFSQTERFAVAYADEIFNPDSLRKCLQYQYSWLCFPVSPAVAKQSGIPTIDDSGKITAVVEKPENPASNVVLNGFMVVSSDIFSNQLVPHPSGEYYLTDLMAQFIKNHEVYAVIGPHQPSLTSVEDLERLNREFVIRHD